MRAPGHALGWICALLLAACATGALTSAKQAELLRLKFRDIDRAGGQNCAGKVNDASCVGIPRAAQRMVVQLEKGKRVRVRELLKLARWRQAVLLPPLLRWIREDPDRARGDVVASLMFLDGAKHTELALESSRRPGMSSDLIEAAVAVDARFGATVALAHFEASVARSGPLLVFGSSYAADDTERLLEVISERPPRGVLTILRGWSETIQPSTKSANDSLRGSTAWWRLARARVRVGDEALMETLQREVKRFGVADNDAHHVAPVFGYHPGDGEVVLSMVAGDASASDRVWLQAIVRWARVGRSRPASDGRWSDAVASLMPRLALRAVQLRGSPSSSLHLDAAAALLEDKDALARLQRAAAASPSQSETWDATKYLVDLDPVAASEATIALVVARLTGATRVRTSLIEAWSSAAADPGLAWFALALSDPESDALITMARRYPPDCQGWLEIARRLRSAKELVDGVVPDLRSQATSAFIGNFTLSALSNDWCTPELAALASDDSAVMYARTAALHLLVVRKNPEFDGAFDRVFVGSHPEESDVRRFRNMRDLWDTTE